MHHAMNGEYAGFFDIGMVQRNEANAIIVHGTMCLIRRTALAQAGGWSSDTIVEDTDLGLTILEQGWLAHYTNRRYGHGLLPDNFQPYKRQRHRWAYGGFQILRKHWRSLPAGREPAHPRAEARIRAGLAELARRREHRRAGGAAQSDLGAVRGVARHRDPRQGARPFRSWPRSWCRSRISRALPAAREDPAGAGAWRGVRRHVGAMDGGARGRLRADQGPAAVRAHRQGRQRAARPGLPGVLGGGDRRPADRQRDLPLRDQLGRECAKSTCSRWCLWCSRCRSCRRLRLAALEGSRANEFAAWRALEGRASPALLPQRGRDRRGARARGRRSASSPRSSARRAALAASSSRSCPGSSRSPPRVAPAA